MCNMDYVHTSIKVLSADVHKLRALCALDPYGSVEIFLQVLRNFEKDDMFGLECARTEKLSEDRSSPARDWISGENSEP